MSTAKVICIVPVRNEAWILARFLECASLWSDHIIIADQNSTDGSRDIAKQYSKVILIDNVSEEFNEPERQKLLISEARKIEGQRILIALDADECLTGNFLSSPEWKTLTASSPGTVLKFQWINLLPDMQNCWIPKEERVFGFVDDGISEHVGRIIHSQRVPIPERARALSLKEIKILHYQYADWSRMQSKHRWYQMWERINHPQKSSISIYRRYNHMYPAVRDTPIPIDKNWFKDYVSHDIDMTSVVSFPRSYWWDQEVIKFFEEYTPQYFSKIGVWDCQWKNKNDENLYKIEDPRSVAERFLHSWLRKSQFVLHHECSKEKNSVYKIANIVARSIDRILILLGY